MSHSTVEKQRRDRINSLIDELRDLVPARGRGAGAEGADSKRPKHTVLSDTICLLRDLKSQGVATGNRALPSSQLKLNGDLPLAPDGAGPAFGIIVEESDNSEMDIKVQCENRDGLLFDIVSALRDLNLPVLTAAVTTSADGNVVNVFKVRRQAEQSQMRPQALQQLLYAKLWPSPPS